MKCLQLLTPILVSALLGCGLQVLGIRPSFAEEVKFSCYPAGYEFNQPITVIHTPYGQDVPVIVWKSLEFAKWSRLPEQRCQEVTQRLQAYYTCDLLDSRYISAATLPWTENGQTTYYPAVVVTHPSPKPCSMNLPAKVGTSQGYVGLLFMLPAERDAYRAAAKIRQILNQLDDLRFTTVEPLEN